MLKYILLLLAPHIQPLPATGLKWAEKHITAPALKNYQLRYSDLKEGYSVHTGHEYILGVESEIQLYYVKEGYISRALLILGPSGMNYENCNRVYGEVVELLNKKYGEYKKRLVEKDLIAKDLVFDSYCSVVKSGALNISTVWLNKEFKIICTMLGDEGSIYIEIDYIKLSLAKQASESETKSITDSL